MVEEVTEISHHEPKRDTFVNTTSHLLETEIVTIMLLRRVTEIETETAIVNGRGRLLLRIHPLVPVLLDPPSAPIIVKNIDFLLLDLQSPISVHRGGITAWIEYGTANVNVDGIGTETGKGTDIGTFPETEIEIDATTTTMMIIIIVHHR